MRENVSNINQTYPNKHKSPKKEQANDGSPPSEGSGYGFGEVDGIGSLYSVSEFITNMVTLSDECLLERRS